LETSLSDKDPIQFSSEPILLETPVFQFNKNIVSLKVKQMLENKSDCLKFNDNQKKICTKCRAFFSAYSETIENQWNCVICEEPNTSINSLTIPDKQDVEYLQNVPSPTLFSVKEPKIIVFCIDISGSMSGNRLNMVKEACIKTLNKIEKESPEFKVALLTFESTGRYYGDCTKQTVETKPVENDFISNSSTVKSLADNLLPIKNTHNMLVNSIKNLNASGGTCICSALAHSVFLASGLPNSEVILCTDGAASDKSDAFYDDIIQYCNTNGFIKINIISFGDEDCDLASLGKLSANTKAKLSYTSDPLSFDAVFSEITNESFKSSLKGQVNLSILVSDGIKLGQISQSLEIKGINKNEKELLLEFFTTNSEKHKEFVYFQFQLFYDNSTRVITKKIKLNSKQESHRLDLQTEIVHAFALRKLSEFVLNKNLFAAENFTREYKKFMNETNESSESVSKTIDLISNLNASCNLDNEKASIIQNNCNVCSFEIDCVRTILKENVSPVNYNEITDHFQENKKLLQDMFSFNPVETKRLNEFEKKLTCIFQKFNLDFLKSTQRDRNVNIKKLLAVIELTEHAHNLVEIAKSMSKDAQFSNSGLKTEKKNKEYQIREEEKKPETYENLFEKILQDFSCFESVFDRLKNISVDCTKWFNEKHQQDLFIDLNRFIYSVDSMGPNNDPEFDNLISTFDEASLKLIQKAKFCAKQTADQQRLYRKRKDIKINRSNTCFLKKKQNSSENCTQIFASNAETDCFEADAVRIIPNKSE